MLNKTHANIGNQLGRNKCVLQMMILTRDASGCGTHDMGFWGKKTKTSGPVEIKNARPRRLLAARRILQINPTVPSFLA